MCTTCGFIDAPDADKSGFLDKAETKALLKDFLAVTKEAAIQPLEAQRAESQSQGAPPAAIEMQTNLIKTLKEWQPNEDEVAAAMWTELDENGDGKVLEITVQPIFRLHFQRASGCKPFGNQVSSQEFLDHWEAATAPIGMEIAMVLMGGAMQGMGAAAQECKQQ
jgi:hypothetical protein